MVRVNPRALRERAADRAAAGHAASLLGAAEGGGAASVGYPLKDRVADVGEFVEALNRVGAGSTALDPEVVTQLFGASRRADGLGSLTAREREVLALTAEAPLAAEVGDSLSNGPPGWWRPGSARDVGADMRTRHA